MLSRRQLLLTALFFSISLLLPRKANAQSWYFPMDRYLERQTVKGFSQYIDNNFYISKENLFPYNRFFGHHSGVDLEILKGEEDKNVSVYAVGLGKILFIGNLSGYGGVIVQGLEQENNTILYGHIKIADLSIKIGDQVEPGQQITFLGDSFSKETSQERKHLHFAIHKGKALYFRGHESSRQRVLAQWEDPNQYLADRKTLLPGEVKVTEKPLVVERSPSPKSALNIFQKILLFLQSLFLK